MVFTGIKDMHRKDKKGEHIILPLYEDVMNIDSNHHASRFNAILSAKK